MDNLTAEERERLRGFPAPSKPELKPTPKLPTKSDLHQDKTHYHHLLNFCQGYIKNGVTTDFLCDAWFYYCHLHGIRFVPFTAFSPVIQLSYDWVVIDIPGDPWWPYGDYQSRREFCCELIFLLNVEKHKAQSKSA